MRHTTPFGMRFLRPVTIDDPTRSNPGGGTGGDGEATKFQTTVAEQADR